MDDAIRATIELMEAPQEKISIRTSYNLSGLSLSPHLLYQEIKKHIPSFKIKYEADFRQQIADSWTESIDDSAARNDWGWHEEFDITKMTNDMMLHLKPLYT
jgi:nucleoside-diphosphate-sugar epimerase